MFNRLKKFFSLLLASILLATIVGVFLPPAKEAKAAISLVQKKTASGTASVNIVWDSPTTTGNLLVAVVNNISTTSGHSVTPPSGWSYATSATFGTYNQFQILYKENATSQVSTGSFTSPEGDTLEVAVAEYSGIVTASALDKYHANITTNPSTTISTGSSGITSQADELIIAGVASASSVTFSAPNNSFSIQQSLSRTGFLDRIVSSVGSYSLSLTQSSSAISSGLIATFKAVAGSTNTAPSISSGPSDGGSSSATPTIQGNNVTFTATATDSESNNYYLAVCKTNSVNAVSNLAPTCPGGNWAISSSTASGSQSSVSYTTSNSGFDEVNNNWYAFVCDNNSASLCSSSSQGSGNNGSPFVVVDPGDNNPPPSNGPTGIRVSVLTTGEDGLFSFNVTGSGYKNFSIQTSAGSGSDSQTSLSPGTYSVTQSLPEGWIQDSFICNNGTPEAVVVLENQITSCSVVNSTGNPTPIVESITPSGALVNSSQVVISVLGSNFIEDSVVKFNSRSLSTTYVSSTKLTATVLSSDINLSCNYNVEVFNPTPGGGSSDKLQFVVSDAIPNISSISPSSRPFGSGSFTMTVSGSNFTENSVVNFNGQDQETTYVSSTQLKANILASYVSRVGQFNVLVLNPVAQCENNDDSEDEDPTQNPKPATTSISPASVNAGASGFVMTINGNNFVPNSIVKLNNQNRATTYISSTKLTALITSSDLVNPASYNIAVSNPTPGGGISNAQVFSVNSQNPSPTIVSISPSSVDAGGPGFTLTVEGTNFLATSQGKFNSQNRITNYISETELEIEITVNDLTTGGSYNVIIDNSSTGGGVSNPKPLAINSPVPEITSISPSSADAGGSNVVVTVSGTGFVKNSKVKYNNVEKVTTFLSATNQLRIVLSATDLQNSGNFDVVVVNPSPGGGTSNAKIFTVIGGGGENPAPIITSLSPSSGIKGGLDWVDPIIVYGSNLMESATFKMVDNANGNTSNFSTTYVSSTQLKVYIGASFLAQERTLNSMVVNPDGQISNVKVFSVLDNGGGGEGNPAPTITSISPSSVTVGSSGFTLTVNGTNFVGSGGSTVMFNGSNRTTTFISSTKLNATIPASDLINTGTFSIKVSNSDGNSSNSANFTVSNISWTARDSSRTWIGVAMSSDGTKQTAVPDGGQIYTSSNSGVTWTARDSSRNWIDIAMSSDGTTQTAVPNGGQIYTSSDSGVTWTARNPSRTWFGVAMSSDGTKQTAVVAGGQIYTSSNSGVTWTARDSSRSWYDVAMSSDGTKQTAVVFGGQIYTSSDSGVTWTSRDSSRNWYDITMSSDGTKQIALTDGQMYTSSDSGATWTAGDSSRSWYDVAMSSDGTKQTAVVVGGQIYTSSDSGVTWTAMDSVRYWHDVAMSSDGTKQTAVVWEGRIYTYGN
ncbi:MAG: hypothetical protein FJZ43_02535 [Candidatus Staskawiczbacteria bacterium]|nr:hypothetical protein [Candidatus Staskawiczbacteria bacterium]